MVEISEIIENIRTVFNNRSAKDHAFRESLANFEKTIAFTLKDNDSYWFQITKGTVPSINKGIPLRSDIKLISNTESLLAILSGALDPMKAMMTGKLKISGSISDVLWLKKFLERNREAISGLLK